MKEHTRHMRCLERKDEETENERRRIRRLDHDRCNAHVDRLLTLRDHSLKVIDRSNDRPTDPLKANKDPHASVSPFLERCLKPAAALNERSRAYRPYE